MKTIFQYLGKIKERGDGFQMILYFIFHSFDYEYPWIEAWTDSVYKRWPMIPHCAGPSCR